MKNRKILFLCRTVSFLVCFALCLCGGCSALPQNDVSASADSPVTLRILLRGNISGLDRVMEQLYNQMDETHRWRLDITLIDAADYAQQLARCLTAHEDYDLVFDAPWLSLATQADQHSYKNLKSYFNNPDYAALLRAFNAEYLNANRIGGELYGIPFTNTYYDVPGIFYRQDLLEKFELDFDTITTREQLLEYWQAVADDGTLRPVALGSRGFYLLNLPEITLRQFNIWDITGWSFWSYPAKAILSKDGSTVLDIVFPGDAPERFAALPEPYNYDFLLDFFLQNADYSQYPDPNDLLQNDGKPSFLSGEAASYEATQGSGGSAQVQQLLQQNVPDAKVGFWAYDSAFEMDNRRPGAIPTNYAAWNFLCIPSYNDNPDEVMAFLDWLYSDFSRLDMFNYGVEGQDWEAVGETEYRLLENPAGAFSFPSYELAWTPLHHRIDTTLPAAEKELMEYIYSPESYTLSPLSGFNVSTSRIGIELACLNALYETYYTGFMHGAYGDKTAAKVQEFHEHSVELGLETVRMELIHQLQQHLDART